jgi:hypothetical protein
LVTDAQVRRLREKRMDGNTVGAAAAAAGMSERSARRWQALTLFDWLCDRFPGHAKRADRNLTGPHDLSSEISGITR